MRRCVMACSCSCAIATGPRFRAALVPAIATRVGVLHDKKLKVFFPIGPLFFERGMAATRSTQVAMRV